MKRRVFIGASAAALALAGCGSDPEMPGWPEQACAFPRAGATERFVGLDGRRLDYDVQLQLPPRQVKPGARIRAAVHQAGSLRSAPEGARACLRIVRLGGTAEGRETAELTNVEGPLPISMSNELAADVKLPGKEAARYAVVAAVREPSGYITRAARVLTVPSQQVRLALEMIDDRVAPGDRVVYSVTNRSDFAALFVGPEVELLGPDGPEPVDWENLTLPFGEGGLEPGKTQIETLPVPSDAAPGRYVLTLPIGVTSPALREGKHATELVGRFSVIG